MPLAVDSKIPVFTDLHFNQVMATYHCRHETKQVFLTDAYERYSSISSFIYSEGDALFVIKWRKDINAKATQTLIEYKAQGDIHVDSNVFVDCDYQGSFLCRYL